MSLLMNFNEGLLSCSLQITTNGGRITDKVLKIIPPVYLGFQLKVEKAIFKYCRRNILELLSLTSELRKSWTHRSEEVEKT